MSRDLPMWPHEAHAELHSDQPANIVDMINAGRRAIETLAAMHTEDVHGLVPWEEVDGAYVTRTRTRLVSDWVTTREGA